MIKLHQFPISHFCEKVRWALDYKNIEYKKINLIPGLHIKKMKRLSGISSVPVIQDDNQVIAGSMEILDYLDQQYPQNRLTPSEPDLQEQVREWELFADKNIGVPVRQICYDTLLKHPNLVRQFFTQNGPWYGPIFVRMAYTKLSGKMRYFMNINPPGIEQAKWKVAQALQKIQERLADNEFLVGDQFSRADLTIAALFAPFKMPTKYGLHWPAQYPAELGDYIATIDGQLQWLTGFYEKYR